MTSAILSLDSASVFYDGGVNEPRLVHPEGLAIDSDGSVWCGTGTGDIIRIAADGKKAELMGSTGGFALGMDFDEAGNLFVCDMKFAAVYRRDAKTGKLQTFASGLRIPNVPLIDRRRNVLFVSDSYDYGIAGPGVWRFDLGTGEGTLWYRDALAFANGLAIDPRGDALFVAESGGRCVRRIPINTAGEAGLAEPWVDTIERVPDGLGWDNAGNLLIACYEPSRLYRVRPDRRVDLLIDDPDARILCHPANVAMRGNTLFTTNLGRWHITAIDMGEA